MTTLLHYFYTTCNGERVAACSRVERITTAPDGIWATFATIYGGTCKVFIKNSDIIQIQEVTA